MNQRALQHYLSAYKRNFTEIRRQEQYKWQAVQHFQDRWDPDADDFATMLEESLSKTSNLLDSGSYFPRKMLLQATRAEPGRMKQAFHELFDEHLDLDVRIGRFRALVEDIVNRRFPGKKAYQDDRAILVYLTLRHPSQYYLYKFGMLKGFCEKTDYEYRPKQGAFENIEVYFAICAYLKTLIVADDELMRLHREHLTAADYIDSTFNILTQDVIYAIQRYLPDSTGKTAVPVANAPQSSPHDLETPPAFDIHEPAVPGRVETTTYRVLRSTKIAEGIKTLYNYCCQLCGETIQLTDRLYSEAHHIKPLGNPHNGPDHESNIISVCPNHHTMLDYGAITLDIAALNVLPSHHLSSEYIDYHNTEIYRGAR